MNRPRLSPFPNPSRIGASTFRNSRAHSRRFTRFVVLLLLAITVTGCTSTSFVYNRLDWLLPWYLDDYTELNKEQERYLDDQLEPFLRWHRESELPCYLGLVDQIDTTIGRKVSVEDVELIATALERAWLRTQNETLDWMFGLGEQLSQEQIDEFLQELDEQQREAQEEYLDRTEEEFQEDNYDTLRGIAEDYLGKLQQAQREELREVSKSLRRSDTLWLQERELFQQQLAQILQREPGWQTRARQLIDGRFENAPEEYQAVIEHNTAVIQAWVASLLSGRTEKQDARLRKSLDKLRGQIEKLIAQADNPSACAVDIISNPEPTDTASIQY